MKLLIFLTATVFVASTGLVSASSEQNTPFTLVGVEGHSDGGGAIQVGKGYWDEKNNPRAIYASYETGNIDLNNQDWDLVQVQLGFKGESFGDNASFNFDVFLYQQEISKKSVNLTDQIGIGIGVGAGRFLGKGVKVSAYAEAIPEWLSNDWDSAYSIQTKFELRADYLINKNVLLKAKAQNYSGLSDKEYKTLSNRLWVGFDLML